MTCSSELTATQCLPSPLLIPLLSHHGRFNSTNLFRVYPNASRINSSNYSPGNYWAYGCQLVTLNYQTNGDCTPRNAVNVFVIGFHSCTFPVDVPMQHNMAVFSQNGGCGYIPKPQDLRKDCESMLLGEKLKHHQLTITVDDHQLGDKVVLHAEFLCCSLSLARTWTRCKHICQWSKLRWAITTQSNS